MKTHCCYYNTDCGIGGVWLRDANIEPPKNNPDYWSSVEASISISVATADEEDGEPQGQFSLDMRCKNIPAKLTDRKFNVNLRAYLTKDELKRLHAVFGLLLGISEP